MNHNQAVSIRGIRHKPKRMFGDAWRNGRAPRAAAPAAATANEDARSRFAKKAELGYVQLKEKFTAKTAQIADAAIEMQVNKFFRWVGPYAKDAMVPPYLPESAEKAWRSFASVLWSRIEDEMYRAFVLSNKFSGPDGEYRELRTMYWARTFPRNSGCWAWLRARLLHALNPADENVFLSLRNPFAVFVLALRLCPFYGISILVYCLSLFIIDRTDEYQLVNFVLEFKGFQFVSSGLLISFILGYQAVWCMVQEHGGITAEPTSDACLRTAVSMSDGSELEFWLELWLQPLRIVLVYFATFLLLTGRPYGGDAELRALEASRLDAADGELDGDADRQYLRLLRNQCERTYEIELEEMQVYLEKHRADHQASTRCGGCLKWFVLFDVVMLCMVVGSFAFLVGYLALPSSDGLYWALLYYANCVYSLLAFPFLVFKVPVVGEILHGALPTGYDKMGMLVPKLSWVSLKEKGTADEEAEKEGKRAESARRKYSRGDTHKPYDVDRQVAKLQRRRHPPLPLMSPTSPTYDRWPSFRDVDSLPRQRRRRGGGARTRAASMRGGEALGVVLQRPPPRGQSGGWCK